MLPQHSVLTIYKSFVRPHLDYDDILYDQPDNKSFCQKIETVQYNAALAITSAIKGIYCNWIEGSSINILTADLITFCYQTNTKYIHQSLLNMNILRSSSNDTTDLSNERLLMSQKIKTVDFTRNIANITLVVKLFLYQT